MLAVSYLFPSLLWLYPSQAILPASLETLEGKLKPKQLANRVDRPALLTLAQRLLQLTYSSYPPRLTMCWPHCPAGQSGLMKGEG